FWLGEAGVGNLGWGPCGRKGGVTRPAFPERYWSVSSGRGASDSVRLRRGGMCGCGEEKFVVGSVRTPEPQAREAKNTLEMGEQHHDFFPPAAGPRVFRSCGVRTGHVAGVFIKVSRDLAGDRVRTALGFEFAGIAIQFAGAIESCALGCDAASGNGVGASELNQFFARGADVTVAFRVEGKVGAG